jgi:hypothetical protein
MLGKRCVQYAEDWKTGLWRFREEGRLSCNGSKYVDSNEKIYHVSEYYPVEYISRLNPIWIPRPVGRTDKANRNRRFGFHKLQEGLGFLGLLGSFGAESAFSPNSASVSGKKC